MPSQTWVSPIAPIAFRLPSPIASLEVGVPDCPLSPIWWGVVTVVCIETGMITPPFGLNLFVMKSIAPGVPLSTVYRGVLPFCLADVVRVVLLIAFPAIVLWLPGLM